MVWRHTIVIAVVATHSIVQQRRVVIQPRKCGIQAAHIRSLRHGPRCRWHITKISNRNDTNGSTGRFPRQRWLRNFFTLKIQRNDAEINSYFVLRWNAIYSPLVQPKLSSQLLGENTGNNRWLGNSELIVAVVGQIIHLKFFIPKIKLSAAYNKLKRDFDLKKLFNYYFFQATKPNT